MSESEYNKRRKLRLARLDIEAELYKRGYTFRQIRREVMARLGIPNIAIGTIHRDIQILLAEWREERIDNIDYALQLELQRIDDTVRELWAEWEKSKEDYVKVVNRRKGEPKSNRETGETGLRTVLREETETPVQGLGDVAYITEIRQQLAERRKLLGLYAPEKRDVTGNMSFASLLVESGMLGNETEKT